MRRLIDLPSPDETERFGASLGRILRAGDVVALEGPLGAGKTTLARAAIRAAVSDPTFDGEVPSPTYTLVQAYAGDQAEIWHFDLYRIGSPDDLTELGWDQLGEVAALIEWPERAGPRLPETRLVVRIEIKGDGRRAVLEAVGEDWQKRLNEL